MFKKLRCFSYGIAVAVISMNQINAQDVIPLRGDMPLLQVPVIKSPAKLSAPLRKLYEAHTNQSKPATARTRPVENTKIVVKDPMVVNGDRVLVDITMSELTAASRAKLQQMGMKITGAFGRMVSGTIPIVSLPLFESDGNVKFVKSSVRRTNATGFENFFGHQNVKVIPTPVISQGDTALRSYLARKIYGVTGKGVKVGILSDSYDNLGTAAIGVKNGELPGAENPFGHKKPVQVLLDYTDTVYSVADEGRGMAEIIHDVAPDAELAFHSAFLGQASFAEGIIKLAEAGCNVIVDDVAYLEEPFYQDGIIAQAVDQVKKMGVAYFSSAGNSGASTYESNYRPSTYAPFGAGGPTAHNFAAPGSPAVYYQPVIIPTNGVFEISLSWDQPSFSAGGLPNGTDIDIYLLNSNFDIVAFSEDDNLASGEPFEYIGVSNGSRNTLYYVMITKFAGVNPTRVKYLSFGNSTFPRTTPSIPGTSGSTIFGHSNAAGAISVGAAYFLHTPAYGVDTPRIQDFQAPAAYASSIGGLAIVFDGKGKRINPVIRKKPEFTAVDGGNTSFFPPYRGQDIRADADTFPNFFGTSAAAPHAAAVAALMIEAQKLKKMTPDQVRGIMAANTVDMDNPYFAGFEKGFDFATGTGFIKADAAVGVVKFPNVYVRDLHLKAVCSDAPNYTREWVVTNPNPFEVEVHWLINGFSQQGSFMAAPGDNNFTSQTAYFFNQPISNIAIIDWNDNLGIPHFDLAGSTTAKCNLDLVTAANTDKITDMVAGAETPGQSNAITVYPNPTSTNIRIDLSSSSQQRTELSLYTLEGKLLMTKIANASSVVDIDASSYKPGMYILKIKQKDLTKTFKVVKK